MKKKKILLVANVAKEHVIKFHIPTIKMLSEQGCIIDVACSGDETVPYCSHQYKMSYKRSPFNPHLLKGILELKKIIKNGAYDLVYCHTPVGGLAARVASASMRKKGLKVIYFAHGYHFYTGAPKLNWLVYYPLEKILSYFTDSIIVINKQDYELTKRKFKTCKVYQLNGIGVNEERFHVENKELIRSTYRKEMNIPDDANVLIYLAELLPNKNQTYLMRAVKRVLKQEPNSYLILAGFDHSHGEFEKYAMKLGIEDHVRFLGWREDVGNLYAMADICTATSIREGFGLNLVEAMTCGIPIVATNNRGHETIIRDGENGFLVDLDDEKLFARRVVQLIRNEKLRKKFIDQGKAEAQTYSSKMILENIMQILDEHMR